MELREVIAKRRAYRALAPVDITDELLAELAVAAALAPSCYNNQPWRFVAAYQPEVLDRLHDEALPTGNAWAKASSLVIAVCSQPDLDCQIKGRDYYLFDSGMATAFMLLTATELGLVAHPIAGYREDVVKEILDIPTETTVIALVIVGRHDPGFTQLMNERQVADEAERPTRLEPNQFFFKDHYDQKQKK